VNDQISGAHVIISSSDAAADRTFFRDVLGFESVDAGGGWLIFALPPAELALHPGTNGEHQLYLMCTDIDATIQRLEGKGVPVKTRPSEQSWGRLASVVLPGGGEIFIYQPSHPTPAQAKPKARTKARSRPASPRRR
jgi:catechol 2,3-dioxygenase-like lactoylglutathione lyase family enzyme